MIERYLDELRRLLPRAPDRGRILAEVEAHLRDAAARFEHEGTSREDAERKAVGSFGSPVEFAGELVAEQAARAVGWASRVLLVVVAGFVPLYGFVENAAPPAPWPSAADTPAYLVWKLAAVQYLVLAGAILALAVFVAAHGYRRKPGAAGRARPLAALAALSGGALAAAATLAALETAQRAALYRELAVAESFTAAELSVVIAAAAGVGLAALGAVGWALRSTLAVTRA